MGRPFRGSVTDTSGREDHVVIKRSIFRLVKRIYGSEEPLDESLGEGPIKKIEAL